MDSKSTQDLAADRQTVPTRMAPLAVGKTAGRAEAKSLGGGDARRLPVSPSPPVAHGLGAFIVGVLLVAGIEVSTWLHYTYLSPDMAPWVPEGIGGGIVMVILAFAYTGMMRPTFGSMRADGITPAGE